MAAMTLEDWKDQAEIITAHIIEKAKSFGSDGSYGYCPSELLTDIGNRLEDENAALRDAANDLLAVIDMTPLNDDDNQFKDHRAVVALRALASDKSGDFHCTCCPWTGSDTHGVICGECETLSRDLGCDDECPECSSDTLWDACPECGARCTTLEHLSFKQTSPTVDGEECND